MNNKSVLAAKYVIAYLLL